MAIIISEEKCTGCAVCSSACVPLALLRSVDGGRLSIAIDYSKCNLCGDCERLCPENALRITERPVATPGVATLFACQMAKCDNCGRCFAPKPLIDKFKAILKDRGPRIVATLGLCPVCKDLAIDEGL